MNYQIITDDAIARADRTRRPGVRLSTRVSPYLGYAILPALVYRNTHTFEGVVARENPQTDRKLEEYRAPLVREVSLSILFLAAALTVTFAWKTGKDPYAVGGGSWFGVYRNPVRDNRGAK